MKIVIKKNNETLLHACFALWLASEYLLQYSVVSRVLLLLFVGMTVIITQKITWHYGLTGYALFLVWSVVNIVTGHATSRTQATGMTQTVVFCALFLYAFVCYCKYIGDMQKIFDIFRVTIIICCIPCLVGGFGNFLTAGRLSLGDAGGKIVGSNYIAMPCAYAGIIEAHNLLKKGRKQLKLRDYFPIVMLLLTVLLTASRKGLIIFGLGLYILICFRSSGKFVRNSLLMITAGCIVLALLLNVPALYDVAGKRIESLLLYIQGEEFEEGSLNVRVNFINLAWKESQNSLFWGHGLDCFRLLRYAFGVYSHNNFVEILYSLGWTGVALYYLPYVKAFLNVPRAMKRNRELASVALAIFVPYVICDYMNVTYFTRLLLIVPVMAMMILDKRGLKNEYC